MSRQKHPSDELTERLVQHAMRLKIALDHARLFSKPGRYGGASGRLSDRADRFEHFVARYGTKENQEPYAERIRKAVL